MIKDLLKKYLLVFKIRNRFGASVQISQRQLYLKHRENYINQVPVALKETGFRVFSQFEEDGLLMFIFSVIGMDKNHFVEIGSDDGINSNSANLYFNFGWHGLFIDGNPKAIERGRYIFGRYPHGWFYKPKFICAKVTCENVNELISEAGYNGEIGLLSIDVDGYDYWLWDKIDIVEPRVVIIETHNEFGFNDIVVPYDKDYVFPGKHPVYHGASPVAMTKLARKKGYRLVGANQLGSNFIFVKNGFADDYIPEVDVADVLTHPSVTEGYRLFEPIKNWEYVTPL